MSEIDWSYAPEGATHYRPSQPTWYKQTDRAYEWRGGRWELLANDLGEFGWSTHLVERGRPWTGEGLPPVGVTFDWRYTGCNWQTGKALYIGSVYAIILEHSGEQHYYLNQMEFRAHKTPEQIAAEERESAVLEMARCMMPGDVAASPKEFERAEKLYDAGYRKP